jgi:hypothetical protein
MIPLAGWVGILRLYYSVFLLLSWTWEGQEKKDHRTEHDEQRSQSLSRVSAKASDRISIWARALSLSHTHCFQNKHLMSNTHARGRKKLRYPLSRYIGGKLITICFLFRTFSLATKRHLGLYRANVPHVAKDTTLCR